MKDPDFCDETRLGFVEGNQNETSYKREGNKAYEVWLEESDPEDVDYNESDESDGSDEETDNESDEETDNETLNSEGDRNENGSENQDERESAGKRKRTCEKKKESDDDEDVIERFEYDVEESVAKLVDEPYIGRNTVPDSSDEDEDPIVVRDRKIKRVRDDRLAVGNAFVTGLEFKEVLLDYALSKGQNVVQDRWEKNKIGFRCGMGGKCEWRVYCSYDEQKQIFLVKTTYLWHNCIPNGKCKILKSPVSERLFMDKLQLDEKSMVPMLETIRRQAMQRITKRNKKSRNHKGKFSEYIGKMLALEKKDADRCTTYRGTQGMFEVVLDGNSYRVEMKKLTCSCGTWQLSGIPCEHAYGAMIDAGLNPEDYVSGFFPTDMWCDLYETGNIPLRGPKFWMNSSYHLIIAPLEPILPGRKKKKKTFARIKSKHESPKKKQKKTYKENPHKEKPHKETLGRKGRTIHCSSCGVAGHNAAGCKKFPKKKEKKVRKAKKAKRDVMVGPSSSQGPDIISVTQPTQETQTSIDGVV